MSAIIDSMPPKLAPPGAGLPKLELWFARRLFHWVYERKPRAAIDRLFARERAHILRLVQGHDSKANARRVLIDRLRGLEDSSRFWSVWMTLDHLRIVNSQIAHAIRSLDRGDVPARAASTAAVKPDPDLDESVIKNFEQACDLFTQAAGKVSDLHTSARFSHPWFGPLDAAGWHAMGAMHMRLHRKQMERILSVSA